ncbi:MAG: NADP-dependent isocitrate dehydrogenase [Clostridiales bacterium]|nr:NADP-dependent isocitrate dehydrogenase [Clostridiales bacterium]
MDKIKMLNPIVEMDGDEMTRVIWKMIKEQLLAPFIELNTEYYDLSVTSRDNSDDQITIDAAYAVKKHHVGVKCATITANPQRQEEYHLKQLLPSPNGTIRGILDGTVFRAPIVLEKLHPVVSTWKKPITVARHAYADIFNGTEYHVEEKGTAELTFKNEKGEELFHKTVCEYEGPGVLQSIYNKEKSISSFAHACFQYALSTKQDLWFSTKDTICKIYDGTFRAIFQKIYEESYKEKFEANGITYFYTLIDDAVARTLRSEGGYVWALKNYDGDVMSDMVSSGFGSLAMMTSVLVSPEGNYEYEAAHGTVPRHYYRYLKGESTSTNPMATIFAWSGALRKRGELDGNQELQDFAGKLEKACIETIESGTVTKDLVSMMEKGSTHAVSTDEFFHAISERLAQLM